MKSIVGVTADLHAHPFSQFARLDSNGVNSRLRLICEALDWMISETKSRGGKDVVVGGDFYHVRSGVPNLALDMTSDVLKKHRDDGVTVHLLVGNHDLAQSTNHTSIKALSGLAKIYDKVSIAEIAGETFGFIPWTDDQDTAQKAFSFLKKKSVKFVVGHLGLNGAKFGPNSIECSGHLDLDKIGEIPSFKQCLYGHYHHRQQINKNSGYVGSLLQHTKGESNDTKGFSIITKKGDIEFVENTFSPKFVVIRPGDDISGVRARDYIFLSGKTEDEVKSLSNDITKHSKATADETDYVVDVVREVEIKQRLKLSGLETEKMLSRYIKHEGLPEGIDKKLLLQVGTNLLASQI